LIIGNGDQCLYAPGFAGFGPAQFQNGPGFGFFTEIMIETDDAINFGACQVQCAGNFTHGILADMAKRLLHIVQDWQERAFPILMFGQNVSDRHHLENHDAADAFARMH